VRRRAALADPAVPAWVVRFDPEEWRVGLVVRDAWPNAELGWRYAAWRRWVDACHEWQQVNGGPCAPGSGDPAEEDLWVAIEAAGR
jgi:hypothetical protein